ncbi:MAG: hypothetical protein HY000_15940, partial [Planctomycetes bacterium]|nr:hypothetical protein [Planctomycetota bacterium]
MLAYRTILGLAAAYNVAFGIWAGFFPESFFVLFDLPPPRYPSIWACVGMVVGVYAIAYAVAAWRPERADVLVAIGLLGKVLGPLGWLHAVWTGELPPRTFPIILANDLIWWFPFLFYLLRRLQRRRTIVAWTAVVLHVIACVGLIAVHGGTEAEADISERARWVTGSAPLWTAVWLSWSLASMSLLAFVIVWSARLQQLGSPRLWVVAGCVTCAA